ncbi:hypothetical protein [Ewingella americana]|uniref:hypothetical protein n=1 Tax=Ewingella americana TaxID=41202 RepID=UPI0012ADBED0|nr:hypothetical protein [Ewingella americana]MRT04348.1 hypothetical protein [Ewingella americana]
MNQQVSSFLHQLETLAQEMNTYRDIRSVEALRQLVCHHAALLENRPQTVLVIDELCHAFEQGLTGENLQPLLIALAGYSPSLGLCLRHTVSDSLSRRVWLEEKYQQLFHDGTVSTLIAGSSYAFWGIPDFLLPQSLNLSLPCLDLNHSFSVVQQTVEMPSIRQYIITVGVHDLYRDISLETNPLACDIYRMMTRFFSPPRPTNSSQEHHPALIKQVLEDQHQKLISTEAEPRQTSAAIAQQRAIEHSHFAKYTASLQANRQVLTDMLSLAAKHCKTVRLVICPMPREYRQAFCAEMYHSTRQILANSVLSTRHQFIDLYDHPDFEHGDFRDGFHLNFHGASKLALKLAKATNHAVVVTTEGY